MAETPDTAAPAATEGSTVDAHAMAMGHASMGALPDGATAADCPFLGMLDGLSLGSGEGDQLDGAAIFSLLSEFFQSPSLSDVFGPGAPDETPAP